MRILITNDDGVHSPGLSACEKIARALSEEVWIVAPETDQSGVSHSLSLNDPLRMREVGERYFAVKGTPTDCVIMGVRHLMKEKPDLILTGLQSDDLGYGQTGVVLAELLGLPHGTIIMQVEKKDSSIQVKRELEDGWFQQVEMPLPAVLTIQSGINKLRYATLMGIKKAKSKEIKRLTAADLGGAAPAVAAKFGTPGRLWPSVAPIWTASVVRRASV